MPFVWSGGPGWEPLTGSLYLIRKLGCWPAIREQGQKERTYTRGGYAWCMLDTHGACLPIHHLPGHETLYPADGAIPKGRQRAHNWWRQGRVLGSVHISEWPCLSRTQAQTSASVTLRSLTMGFLSSSWSTGSWQVYHLGLLHMLRALLLLLMLLKRTEDACLQEKAALFRGYSWETQKCRGRGWGDCGPDNWTGDFSRKQEMLRTSEERWQTLFCLFIYLFIGFGRV